MISGCRHTAACLQAVFLGEQGGLEGNVVPRSGFNFHSVSTVEVTRPLKSLENLVAALRQADLSCGLELQPATSRLLVVYLP